MKQETVSLLVAAISLTSAVLVVFISSGANIWQKKLDLKQRKADYNQDARRIFINKRIDAAENLVNRYVSIIQQLDFIRLLISSINWEDYSQNNPKVISDTANGMIESVKVINNWLNQPDFKYYLYFDRQIIEQSISSEYSKYLQAERNLLTNLSPNSFGTEKLNALVKDYFISTTAYRVALTNVCSLIRQDVAQYGDPN